MEAIQNKHDVNASFIDQVGNNFPTRAFLAWFDKEKRDLPWRKSPSFYEVLVSELMLQQTVVQTVIPYYKSWMIEFPNLIALAEAPIEKVLKAWEGLGYYSRARNLHAMAKILIKSPVVNETSYDELISIKGIGDYTARAILAFAFKQPCVAIDGNVLRVGARFLGIQENIKHRVVKQRIQKFFDSIDKNDGSFAEGLIELGALICKKNPRCEECPLKDSCVAYKKELTNVIPVVDKRKKIEKLRSQISVILHKNKILVRKQYNKLMKDLWEFPNFEFIEKSLKNVIRKETLPDVSRSYTRYQETISSYFIKTDQYFEIPECEWIEYKKLEDLPFSGGHRKIREIILGKLNHENSTY